ncbi:MAG: transcription termination factor Rho [Chthoniobacteraceae bacterium]
MTESTEQSLLQEDSAPAKKPAKRKAPTAKTKAAAAKTTTSKPSKTAATKSVKPAAKKASAPKKPAKKVAAESEQPDLPAAEEAPSEPETPTPPPAPAPAPQPVTSSVPQVEEWRPSAGRTREPASAQPAATGTASPPAPAPVTPVDPTVPVVRPRPVYIPLHVAKQMEEQARLSGNPNPVVPIALPAHEAAARFDLQPRIEQPHRNERPHRGEHTPRGEQPSQGEQTPRIELPPTPEEIGEAEGIVEVSGKGFGFLRDPKRGFSQHPADVFVTPELCRSYGLRDGQWVKGETRRGNRGAQLFRLTEINGETPQKAAALPSFDELTVLSPMEMISMETVPERYTTRVIDLMTPIGKGQRGLIVAPPRTGKTTLLQHIAEAVVKNHPDIKLIILLVDERPEEVTEIKRTVPSAEIMASSNDSDVKSHTRIAQLAIERAKRLVEAGKDVFILLDSITRVGRAFNNATGGGGRTMSGGIDSRALEIPRKLFAAARNTEEAGSLTIIATALIDTGSRMDELIFQEFKGTGNMELMLDRKISDQRIYPAVDIFLSGTRREELLIPADSLHKINVIRRGLAGHKPMEAMERLLFFLRKFPTNAQMLAGIPG